MMRISPLARAGLLLCLGAGCTLERPEDAFFPASDGLLDNNAGFVVDAGPGGSNPMPPAMGLPPPSSGGVVGADGGMVSMEEEPLVALTGKYLMRADMFTVGTASQPTFRLEVANTTTHLAVGIVTYDASKKALMMTERLCYQVFQHQCRDGCTEWQSVVDARATPRFPYVERPLTVTDKMITGATVSAAYGFDDKNPVSLPNSESDPRVWDLGGGTSVREGVLTRITAKTTNSFVGDIQCDVYTVQRFTSAFMGTLKNGLLDGVSASLNTQGSDGGRVGATGSDASSCTSQSGQVTPGSKPDTIRFKKLADNAYTDEVFWACPATKVFTDALPDP